MRQGKVTDMTKGIITPQILNFTIPLIIGNLCVLTYNAADSIIVGRFIGEDALAALGSAAPVMNIMLFLMIGICLGMSVLMGHFFGAGDIDKLKREISTSIIAGGVFTAFLVIVGYFGSYHILALMATPAEIIDDATAYLQIIFLGLFFSFTYNIYASTLRSMGNSKASLYILIISAILNILLDLLFVGVFHWGVEGAAAGTVVAEFLSALFCIIYVRFKVPLLKFTRKEFVFDKSLFKQTVSYSSVAAMQQITLQIGKLLIQGAVNPLGIFAIAAFNAVNRVDDFVMVAQQNIAHGTTGFLAQNHGAKKHNRLRKGFLIGVRMEVIYTIILIPIIFYFAAPIVRLFVGNEGESVVMAGADYLKVMAYLYLLPAITNIIQGYFRGIGLMKITLNSTFVQIVGRVIAAYILAPIYGLEGIALACLVGWLCMLIYELPIFHKEWKRNNDRIANEVEPN